MAFWKRPKTSTLPKIAAPKESVDLSSNHIRAFAKAYEEKGIITSELSLLDVKARKGKIPRRRYKVQSRKLKIRLAALSNDIAEFKGILSGSGGNYASLVRQLEIAETELKQVETKINSFKVRHRSGEISLAQYKKVLAGYQRRKEKAEAVVTGTILGLREETR